MSGNTWTFFILNFFYNCWRPSRDDLVSMRTAMRQNSFNMVGQKFIRNKIILMTTSVLKLHRKYNPNLINDDEQEIETHLIRRRQNARRISQVSIWTSGQKISIFEKFNISYLFQMVLQSTDYSRPITPGSSASATKHFSCKLIAYFFL